MSFLTRVFADVDFTSEESVWKSGVEAHIEALKSKVTEAAEAAAAAASKQTEAAAAEADESSKSSEEIERLEEECMRLLWIDMRKKTKAKATIWC